MHSVKQRHRLNQLTTIKKNTMSWPKLRIASSTYPIISTDSQSQSQPDNRPFNQAPSQWVSQSLSQCMDRDAPEWVIGSFASGTRLHRKGLTETARLRIIDRVEVVAGGCGCCRAISLASAAGRHPMWSQPTTLVCQPIGRWMVQMTLPWMLLLLLLLLINTLIERCAGRQFAGAAANLSARRRRHADVLNSFVAFFMFCMILL